MSRPDPNDGTPVISLYRKDPLQVGDVASTPANYADELGLPWLAFAEHLDVEDRRVRDRTPEMADLIAESIVIVGGGGLTFDYFHDNISWIAALKPRALIWWGAGHNIYLGEGTFMTHGRWEDLTEEELRYPDYLNREHFDLIGVRDPENTQFETVPFRCVPCPSVMLHSLTATRGVEPTHDAVVYVQKSRIPTRSRTYPVLSNATDVQHNVSKVPAVDPLSIPAAGRADEAVRFLGDGRCVVTNSYHGALWAILLNRPVVALDGWSSKFYKLPADVLMISTAEFESDPETAIGRAGEIHARQPGIDNLLDSSRAANLAFAQDVGTTLEAKRLVPTCAAAR